MMTGNDRTRYPIAAVRERLRRHGGPVLDFAVGPHREQPPSELKKILGTDPEEALRRPCSEDELTEFASAAAGMMRRIYGVEVSPTAVLPVPGGRTAMSFLASTLIRPGDGVAVVEPAYPAFTRVAQQIHASVAIVPLDPGRGFMPDVAALDDDAVAGISFAALNFPNNPTGAVLETDALMPFLQRFRPGTVVFNDATYGPLVFDRAPWSLLSEAAASGERLRLLELHSLAKLFALGPLAVAFLVGDEGIISELREFSEYAWSDQSSLQIQVALKCLEDGDRFNQVRDVYSGRLERLRQVVEGLGFEPFPAASGMYLVCRTPSAIGGRIVTDAEQAAEMLLTHHGVAVVPWNVHPTSYLRFSSQYAEEDLDALAALGANGPLAT